jgi:hypothetical protein
MRKFSTLFRLVLLRIKLEFREGARNAASVINHP